MAQTKQKPGDVLGGNAEAEDSQDDGGSDAEPRFDKPDSDSEVSVELVGDLPQLAWGLHQSQSLCAYLTSLHSVDGPLSATLC